jgi:hypothetical protein
MGPHSIGGIGGPRQASGLKGDLDYNKKGLQAPKFLVDQINYSFVLLGFGSDFRH